MMCVLLGLVVVFLSALDSDDMRSARDPVLGGVLVVVGAFLDSLTYVVLDKMLQPSAHDDVARPAVDGLEGIGWMGFYGCFIQGIALIAMFFIPAGNDRCNGTACMENSVTAWQQLSEAPAALTVAVVLRAIFGMGFQSSGGLITQTLGANTRAVMASLVTVPVWIVSLFLGWQPLNLAQVAGFVLIVSGNLVYNDLVRVPGLSPQTESEGTYSAVKDRHDSLKEGRDSLTNGHGSESEPELRQKNAKKQEEELV